METEAYEAEDIRAAIETAHVLVEAWAGVARQAGASRGAIIMASLNIMAMCLASAAQDEEHLRRLIAGMHDDAERACKLHWLQLQPAEGRG